MENREISEHLGTWLALKGLSVLHFYLAYGHAGLENFTDWWKFIGAILGGLILWRA